MNVLVGMLGVFLCATMAWADTPTVVEDPPRAFGLFREVLDTLSPTAEFIVDITHDEETYNGASIKLLSLDQTSIPWLRFYDVRLGWAETKVVTAGLAVDTTKLTGWPVARFVHLGWDVFYNADDHRWGTGPVVGIRGDF